MALGRVLFFSAFLATIVLLAVFTPREKLVASESANAKNTTPPQPNTSTDTRNTTPPRPSAPTDAFRFTSLRNTSCGTLLRGRHQVTDAKYRVLASTKRGGCAYEETDDPALLVCSHKSTKHTFRPRTHLTYPPTPGALLRMSPTELREWVCRSHLILDTTSFDVSESVGVELVAKEAKYTGVRAEGSAGRCYANIARDGDKLVMFSRDSNKSMRHRVDFAPVFNSKNWTFSDPRQTSLRGPLAANTFVWKDPRWDSANGRPGPYYALATFRSILYTSADSLTWSKFPVTRSGKQEFPGADALNHLMYDEFWKVYRIIRRDNLGCQRRSWEAYECSLDSIPDCYGSAPGSFDVQNPIKAQVPWYLDSVVGYFEEVYNPYWFPHPLDSSVLLNWCWMRRKQSPREVSGSFVMLFSSYDGGRQWHRVGGDDTREYVSMEQVLSIDKSIQMTKGVRSGYQVCAQSGHVVKADGSVSVFVLGSCSYGIARLHEWSMDPQRLAGARCNSSSTRCSLVTYPLLMCRDVLEVVMSVSEGLMWVEGQEAGRAWQRLQRVSPSVTQFDVRTFKDRVVRLRITMKQPSGLIHAIQFPT